jgi:hypothetical protein
VQATPPPIPKKSVRRSQPGTPSRPPKAIKPAPPPAPLDLPPQNLPPQNNLLKFDDDAPPSPRVSRAKPKSNKGLILVIVIVGGIITLAVIGGSSFGIYKLLHKDPKPVGKKPDDSSKDASEKRDESPKDKPVKPDEKKKLDLSFIHAECNAAFVVHPARIAKSKSPLLPPADQQEQFLAGLIQEAGFDPRKLEQAILVTEPAPPQSKPKPPAKASSDSPVFVVFILRFVDKIDGKSILSKALKESEEASAGGKTYAKSKKEKANAGQPLAGFAADERTILLGDEAMLKKMLAARDARGPLLDKLRDLDLDNDLFGVILLAPFKSQIAELAKAPNLPPPLAGLKTIDSDLIAVKIIGNLERDKLVQITLEGSSEQAAANLEKLARALLDMGKEFYKQFKPELEKQMPPDLRGKLLKVADQIQNNGIKVAKEGKNVVVTLEKPKDL